ncbi:MAG: TolC family protein [Sphingomonas sp.]|nr:TolC family protein [Sphingomonas sp.]
MRMIKPLMQVAASALALVPIVADCQAQMIARLPDPATSPQGPVQNDLVDAWRSARDYDPQFRSAVAQRQVNIATANQGLTQYLPSASYQMTSVATENTTRQIVSVTQPLFSVDRYATIREIAPRKRFANATLAVADQNLANRLLTEVTAYIAAVENARANGAKIDALQKQADRSQKMYQSGLGTITDARDIQVQYEAAQANGILLASAAKASAARIGAITGKKVGPLDFRFPEKLGTIHLDTLSAYVDRQVRDNPAIIVALQNERVGRFEALKAKGSLLPTVGLSATYTNASNTGSSSYAGFSVSAPIAPGGFFQVRAANATARGAIEQRRQAVQQARVDLERLYEQVNGGQEALVISAKAIETAQLSVEANTKSFEGGVRTTVDVVNAIQTLYTVRSAYVTQATQLAVNLLTLLLVSGDDTADAMEVAQKFLFGK